MQRVDKTLLSAFRRVDDAHVVIALCETLGQIQHVPPDTAAEDSHNLLPLLAGRVKSARKTHIHNTRANQYAIRHGDWVLVEGRDGYMSGRNKDWEARHDYPADDDSPVEIPAGSVLEGGR